MYCIYVHCTYSVLIQSENIGWIPPLITWQGLTRWWKVGNRLATLVLSLHKQEDDQDGDQGGNQPAERHHWWQVGQSYQLPPHLLRDKSRIILVFGFFVCFFVHHFGLALAREEGSKVHGEGVDPVQGGELAPPTTHNLEHKSKKKNTINMTQKHKTQTKNHHRLTTSNTNQKMKPKFSQLLLHST